MLFTLLACGGIFGDDSPPHYDIPVSRTVTIEYVNTSSADVHMVYGPTASLDAATRVNAGLSREESRSLTFYNATTPGTFGFTVASPSMEPKHGTITLSPLDTPDGTRLRVVWDGTNVTVTKV
ncbi:MAG TPA: hypothetical protein VK934_00845 [Fimbriimonas sp.]|nr:hypothetical protein [Fimbriimonas sp.]